ncbi:SCP-2 sterol transfer family protein [Oceanobacillus limi]|uniref:SCP-2 sterol transfer family protein n=1 Tax=Oceanobacillus limi TaxID=930131 RepID=A0A1I0H5K3_9BACI|nr:SCP2 sterol-binding domain-containing protein [Oceanobacillus limi]SET79026.1 SCP-2 sterol transfer family protein [Oceanobacillus limi]
MDVLENGTITEIWKFVEGKLQENKAPYSNLNATYEFQIIDIQNSLYQVKFNNGDIEIKDQQIAEADCTLKMKEKYVRKFLKGELNSTTAFMTGKLKVEGNIGLALKLEGVLKQYNFIG